MFAQQKAITLVFQPVQSQHGSSDCGLFALAFTTSLCHQENPVEINYTQHKLRSHLLDCFTRGRMSPFPRSSRMRKIVKPRGREKVQVYCRCRLPENGTMIQCDSCFEWFHTQCITVPEHIFKGHNTKWNCLYCS